MVPVLIVLEVLIKEMAQAVLMGNFFFSFFLSFLMGNFFLSFILFFFLFLSFFPSFLISQNIFAHVIRVLSGTDKMGI